MVRRIKGFGKKEPDKKNPFKEIAKVRDRIIKAIREDEPYSKLEEDINKLYSVKVDDINWIDVAYAAYKSKADKIFTEVLEYAIPRGRFWNDVFKNNDFEWIDRTYDHFTKSGFEIYIPITLSIYGSKDGFIRYYQMYEQTLERYNILKIGIEYANTDQIKLMLDSIDNYYFTVTIVLEGLLDMISPYQRDYQWDKKSEILEYLLEHPRYKELTAELIAKEKFSN